MLLKAPPTGFQDADHGLLDDSLILSLALCTTPPLPRLSLPISFFPPCMTFKSCLSYELWLQGASKLREGGLVPYTLLGHSTAGHITHTGESELS